MNELRFESVPAQFGNVTGSLLQNENGGWVATISVDPAGGTEARLASGTDVVVVLDASFSMFAGFYRNARVLDFVDRIAEFVLPYDDDGIDVYLHSLKEAPFRHLGTFRQATEVSSQLGEFMEPASAMKTMGQKTICAPVLREIARMLKEDKGAERVFIEVITDGAFDDAEELESTIVELGRRYNTPEHPAGFKMHFSGIGPGGAKGIDLLRRLDDELESKYPGYIDCVDFDAATQVEENLAAIVKELRHSVRLKTGNAFVTISADNGTEPTHICESHAMEWQDGAALSFEALPATISLHAIFAQRPATVLFDLTYLDAATGASNHVTLTGMA